MNPRHAILAAALVGAAALALFGDTSPPAEVVEPAARASTAPVPSQAARVAVADVAIMQLAPRDTLIGSASDSFNAGANDAFGSRNWTPPPPPPAPAAPPPPPQAPPLPFTLIGKSLDEGKWEVYLARGDQTYLVRDKDVIDGAYRVDAIRPPLMTLTYLPLNQAQQVNIGVFD